MYIYSMVKIISLADDAYESLKTMKKGGESFSDVVRRVVEKEKGKTFLDLAGAWKEDKEIGNIFKGILEDRKSSRLRY